MTTRNWQSKSIEERIRFSEVALTNALSDAEINAELTAVGYDSIKLQAGQALLNSVQDFSRNQVVQYAEQYAASDEVNKAWEAADKVYMRTLKLARIALKNHVKEQIALGLQGERKHTLTGWLDEAKLFYGNMVVSETAKAAMQSFGYTDEKWTEEAGLVDSVAHAVHMREIEKGEAQNATKQRDVKMDELDAWMQDFVAVARIALEEWPQRLEKLGIFVTS